MNPHESKFLEYKKKNSSLRQSTTDETKISVSTKPETRSMSMYVQPHYLINGLYLGKIGSMG